MYRFVSRPRVYIPLSTSLVGAGVIYYILSSPSSDPQPHRSRSSVPISLNDIPSRSAQIERLKATPQFDVLIIGAGATGSGIALDAATRGLSVACIDRNDISSGTSSRSTKLIHGGVRYLEKAFKEADRGQLDLVTEALHERKHLINAAPHLSNSLPILVPLYQPYSSVWFWGPYYYVGVKLYDFFAGRDGILSPSYYMGATETLRRFPQLRSAGLKGSIVYYDGQMNDTRMNVSIALTAAAKGAVVANHVKCVSLIKGDIDAASAEPRVVGARLRDRLSGEEWDVYAKHIINATGPFVDSIRAMASPRHADAKSSIITPSQGTHVILSQQYCPDDIGMIVPTSDGRVLFLLPWEGSTIAGTTDQLTRLSAWPRALESEVQWILKEVSRFLERPVPRTDVDAAWSGIRPLARNPNAKDTQSISRDHVIEVTAPGVVTITGGKWTTYRKMGEDTINAALKANAKLAETISDPTLRHSLTIDQSKLVPCQTSSLPLVGTAGWSIQTPQKLVRMGLPQDIAQHLSDQYGDKAVVVAEIAQSEGMLNRLAVGYPFIDAEVVYGSRHEYAATTVDVLGSRMRLGFLNAQAAMDSLHHVIALLATENHWDTTRTAKEYQTAVQFLTTMNTISPDVAKLTHATTDPTLISTRLSSLFTSKLVPHNDIARLHADFQRLDTDHDHVLTHAQFLELISTSKAFHLNQLAAYSSSLDDGTFVLDAVGADDGGFWSVLQSFGASRGQNIEDMSVGWNELILTAVLSNITRQQPTRPLPANITDRSRATITPLNKTISNNNDNNNNNNNNNNWWSTLTSYLGYS